MVKSKKMINLSEALEAEISPKSKEMRSASKQSKLSSDILIDNEEIKTEHMYTIPPITQLDFEQANGGSQNSYFAQPVVNSLPHSKDHGTLPNHFLVSHKVTQKRYRAKSEDDAKITQLRPVNGPHEQFLSINHTNAQTIKKRSPQSSTERCRNIPKLDFLKNHVHNFRKVKPILLKTKSKTHLNNVMHPSAGQEEERKFISSSKDFARKEYAPKKYDPLSVRKASLYTSLKSSPINGIQSRNRHLFPLAKHFDKVSLSLNDRLRTDMHEN